jgi:general stress protein YciG
MLDPAPSDEEIPDPPPSRTRQRVLRGTVRYRDQDGRLVEVLSDHVEFTPARQPRGFAAMTPEQRKAASAKGGATSHANGTAHRFTTESARVAGRRGGAAHHRNRPPSPAPSHATP